MLNFGIYTGNLDAILAAARAKSFNLPKDFTPSYCPDITDNDLDVLKKDIQTAHDFLSSSETLSLNENSDLNDIEECFIALNNIKILIGFSDQIATVCGEIFNAAMGLIPWHRFIPINPWRREQSQNPSEEWMDVDDLIYTEIIHFWDEFTVGDFSQLEYFPKGDDGVELWAEIMADDAFVKELENRSEFWQIVGHIVSQDTPFKLFYMAENAECDELLSSEVAEVFPQAVGWIKSNPTGKVEDDLLHLFGMPGLSDEDRLTLADNVVKGLKNPETPLLKAVQKCLSSEETKENITRRIFSTWNKKLQYAAEFVTAA